MIPQPHQLVGYSALAAEERGALEVARALVDEQLERAARAVSVDLMDMLSHPAAEPYIVASAAEARGDADPLRRPQFAPVASRPFVKMPTALEQALAGVQYDMLAGLFVEIGHAWLSVDHRFFMWDFADPEGGGFVTYDGLDQSIVSAALVRPAPGALADEPPYAVVLATPLEISVLSVRLAAAGEGGGGRRPRLELYHSGVRVLTDNVNMVKMAATASGRVFMAGADGFLYELSMRGWWSARAAKRPRSRALERIRHFVLSSLFDADDPIIELLADAERHALLTLSRGGTVQLYDLGAGGDETRWVCSKTVGALRAELAAAPPACVRRGVLDRLARDMDAAAGAPPSAPCAPLVALSSIPAALSREAQLLLTSASGVRLFVNLYSAEAGGAPAATAAAGGVRALRATAALDPPPSGAAGAAAAGADGGGYGGYGGYAAAGGRADGGAAEPLVVALDGALYAAGCMLLADSRALPHAELVCVAPCLAAGANGANGANSGGVGGLPTEGPDELCESVTRLRLSGAVYAIAEVLTFGGGGALAAAAGARGGGALGASPAAASKQTAKAVADARGALAELQTQPLAAPLRFAVLTAAGVHLFEKQRPLEAMAAALALAGSEALEREHAVRLAFARYGGAEACAMALVLGARLGAAPPFGPAAAAALSGGAICAWARQLGGEARSDGGGYAARASGTSFGQALETADTRTFSGRYYGLAALAARLLMGVWALPVVAAGSSSGSGAPARLALSRPEWTELGASLRQLVRFLSQHREAWGLGSAAAGAGEPPTGAPAPQAQAQAQALLGGYARAPREAGAGGAPTAQQAVEAVERASSLALLRLLSRSAQAASLFALLAEPAPAATPAGGAGAELPFAFLGRLAARLPPAEQAALSALTFADFVCPTATATTAAAAASAAAAPAAYGGGGGGRGRGAPSDGALADRLARSLLLELLRDHQGDPSLVGWLQRECPAFFSPVEYALYRVWTNLAAAAASDAPAAERARALRGALAVCCEHARSLNLRAVVGVFAQLQLYEAIVDLPLAAAAALDPTDGAAAACAPAAGGDGGEAPSAAEVQLLAERLAVYRVTADTLQAVMADERAGAGGGVGAAPRTEMWRRVVGYGLERRPLDALFHQAIFWWLLAAGQAEALAQLASPFLEAFLASGADGGADAVARVWGPMLCGPAGPADVRALCERLRSLEPLAAHYVRNGRHVEAARVFCKLATRAAQPTGGAGGGGDEGGGGGGGAPSLEQREAWLVQAVIAARAAGEGAAALGADFVRHAEELLLVARAQAKVFAELSRLGRTDMSARAQCQRLAAGIIDSQALFALCEQYELHLPALFVLAGAASYKLYTGRVEHHLERLLDQAMATGGWPAACEAVRELRGHFSTSVGFESYVFRLDQISATLERERAAAGAPADAIAFLSEDVEPRVGYDELWRAYADGNTRGAHMQQLWEESVETRIHLFGAIHALTLRWIRSTADGRSLGAFRQPVCFAIDSFIVELNTMAHAAAPRLRDAFKALRKELTASSGRPQY